MSKIDSPAELQGQNGRCVVGAHLDIDSLRVVEVSRGRVARWASVPYPPGVAPGAPTFPAFLKQSMADFHSAFHRASLWVVGPLPSLQVRFLSLPRTRPRQLPNLVYWTFRKEIPFDPAQTIFDYDTEGDAAAAGAAKKTTDATAYTVSRGDVDALVGQFETAGLPVDGVVIPSFALRNLFGVRPLAHAGPALGLYVGSDSSALLFFKGKQVIAHRVFKTGMNVMLDVLRDRYPDWSLAKTYQAIRAALAAPVAPAPSDEPGAVDAARIAETVHVAFDRLIQQVERSLSAYQTGKSEEEIQNIYVAGSVAGLPGLVKELGAKLGLASAPLDLFRPGLLEAGVAPPAGPEAAGMLTLALGAAFSDPARTPNLLHTYVGRAQAARRARWRLAAVAGGIVGLILLAAAGGWIGQRNRRLRAELDAVQVQIRQFAPYPDRAMIQAMLADAARDSRQMKNMAGRSLPVAALNQLARDTPPDVRLTSIALERDAETKTGKKSKDAAAAGPKIRLELNGMVLGPPGAQESKLASYVLRLEDAESFERVVVNRSEEGREGQQQVLLFALDMRMDDLAGKPPASVDPKGATP